MRSTLNKAYRQEDGAALVEFALILPVFMILVLGTFSGGIAYNTKQSITSAAREGSRYGATLPLAVDYPSCAPSANPVATAPYTNFVRCVSDLTVSASSGELAAGSSGRYVCVSILSYDSVSGILTTSSYATDVGASTNDCYTTNGLASDGLATATSRVHVVTKRDKTLQYLVSSTTLHLSASSLTLFETS